MRSEGCKCSKSIIKGKIATIAEKKPDSKSQDYWNPCKIKQSMSYNIN